MHSTHGWIRTNTVVLRFILLAVIRSFRPPREDDPKYGEIRNAVLMFYSASSPEDNRVRSRGWLAWCLAVEKAEGQRTVLLHEASQRGVSWDFLNKRKSDLLICPYISDLSYPVSADLAPRV